MAEAQAGGSDLPRYLLIEDSLRTSTIRVIDTQAGADAQPIALKDLMKSPDKDGIALGTLLLDVKEKCARLLVADDLALLSKLDTGRANKHSSEWSGMPADGRFIYMEERIGLVYKALTTDRDAQGNIKMKLVMKFQDEDEARVLDVDVRHFYMDGIQFRCTTEDGKLCKFVSRDGLEQVGITKIQSGKRRSGVAKREELWD